MMLYQREFLQMEANLGGTNKILFICVNAKDFKNNFTYLSTEWWSYGSAALILEDEKSEAPFHLKILAVYMLRIKRCKSSLPYRYLLHISNCNLDIPETMFTFL